MEPLIVATVSVPFVPLSASVKRVFGLASASFIVSVPLVPKVASVIFSVEPERIRGEAFESVMVPDAAIVVAPDIAPAFVIPPVLLFH